MSDRVDVGNLVIISGSALLLPPLLRPAVITELNIDDDGIDRNIELKFLTRTSRFYRIEKSLDFQRWDTLGDPIRGNGREMRFIDPIGRDSGYYRALTVRSDRE